MSAHRIALIERASPALRLLWCVLSSASCESASVTSCTDRPVPCAHAQVGACRNSLVVPGGAFVRDFDGLDYLDASYPATLSSFYLDKYEVTVGRFRSFLSSGNGTERHPPASGAGAHSRIVGSGWQSAWNSKLATDTDVLKSRLKCASEYQSFTDTAGANENLPINCVDWYTAFAFCAWDGGRLPTEAEWNYTAAGGSEQRYYPWSDPHTSTSIDDSYASYCGGTCELLDVGSKSPKGDGKWGHADLGGNAWEWVLDVAAGEYPMPCHDCAALTAGAYRAFRSGSNDDIAGTLRSATRHIYYPEYRGVVGVRCARNP